MVIGLVENLSYFYLQGSKMKIWIHVLIFAVSSLAVCSQTCPSEHFSAVFTATGTFSGPVDDPELTFFKTYLGLRDSDIQHTTDDAIQFFNNTFGLDFSNSPPNEKNERFLSSAKMSPFMLSPDVVDYIVTDNHWIRTGNTRSSCYHIREGGFQVTFSAERILCGSYGGAEGKPVGTTNLVAYGFFHIDVCKQSPVIIQFQSSTPIRTEPIDGIAVFTSDLYNRVLGYGKLHGIIQIYPDPNESGKLNTVYRGVYTFPAQ